jgi:hypothetical protein
MFNTILKLISVMLLVSLSGCGFLYKDSDTKVETNHMKESQRLYALLASMESIDDERFYTELERDESRLYFANLFSQQLDHVTRDLRHYNRDEFTPLLTQLQSQNLEVKKQLSSYNVEQFSYAISQAMNTCTACHTMYRNK